MRITKVEANNFLSFRELRVQITPGLAAIVGENRDTPGARSNGAGKSSLTDAIAWGLYGETVRGLSGDDVIHNVVRKNCFVAVHFDDGTIVIRNRKMKGPKNAVIIHRNGDPVQYDRMKDAQVQIDRMVGMDWSTFRQGVLFGQDAVRFLALTDSEKKAIVERILGVGVLDRAAEIARKEHTEAEDRIVRHEQEAKLAKTKAEGLEELHASKTADFERRLSDLRERKEEIKDQIAALRVTCDAEEQRLNLEFAEQEKKIKGAESDFAEQEKSEASMIEEIKGAEEKSEAARQSWLKASADAAAAMTTRDRTEAELHSTETLSGDCPTCRQAITAEYRDKIASGIRQRLKDETRALDIARSTEDMAQKTRDESAAVVEALRKSQSKAAARMGELKVRIETAVQEGARLTAELESHADTTAERLRDLQKSLQTLSDQKEDSTQGELDRIDSEAISERDRQKAAEKAAVEAAEAAQTAGFWAEGFGLRGIRSLLLDGVLPYIESRTNAYLDELTGGTCRIALSPISEKKSKRGDLRDSIAVSLSTSHGADSYAGLSGGERQRVDVSVALALFDLARTRAGADMGLAVFDEVFERLDDAGCEAVGSLLRMNADRWGAVLLVTHLDGLLAEIPRRIRIVKEGGESRIEGPQCITAESTRDSTVPLSS